MFIPVCAARKPSSEAIQVNPEPDELVGFFKRNPKGRRNIEVDCKMYVMYAQRFPNKDP